MQKVTAISIFFFGLALGVSLTLGGVYLYSRENASQESALQEDQTISPRVYKLGKDVAVYIPWWDQDRAFESLKENKDYINVVHPFWYETKSDGSIEKFSGAEDQELITFCNDNDIKIIPVISNEQDPIPVEQIFDSEEATQAHVANIIQLVQNNSYDGIEIDYESLESTDRADFSSFIVQLSNSLKENDKELTVAVHAKSSDKGTWGGPAAQDWQVLNQYADSINIMAYDYHWSTSEAGDIAPLNWIEEVLIYAVSVIVPEKITLGVHFYGYDWVGAEAESLTHEGVQELINVNEVQNISTSESFEKYFTYIDADSSEHTVYFADQETVAKRLDLALQYDLSGISIWRLGGEDANNWTATSNKFIF